MPHHFTSNEFGELMSALCGQYSFEIGDGRIRALARHLPGDAVAVICPPRNGVLIVIYDLRKPNAMGHLRDLLREWWRSALEPTAYPDGTIGLAPRELPPTDLRPREMKLTVPA